MNTKVVITGIGVISSLGNSVCDFWQNCSAGKSGIKPIENFDTSSYPSHVGGEITDFNPKAFMTPMTYRRMSRASRFAVAASIQALNDSALPVSDDNAHRLGVIGGTGYGSTSYNDEFFLSLLKEGPEGAQPFLFTETVPNAPASQVSIFHNIKGPLSTISHNNVSGELAIAYAYDLIQTNIADAIIVCGVDELNSIAFDCYSRLRVLCSDSKGCEISKPFCRDSCGIVLGEGAACIVIERLHHAKSRGAPIYGEICSYSSSSSPAGIGKYSEEPEQIAQAMAEAIRISGKEVKAIDFISAAANSSGMLDSLETAAIERVFGDRSSRVLVTALKSQLGEFPAIGVLRAAAVLLSLHNQTVLPTINLQHTDDSPAILNIVKKPVNMPLHTALLNGISFGGVHISIIFERYENTSDISQ